MSDGAISDTTMTVKDILEQSPNTPNGGKWAYYSMGCCWWTSFPEDLVEDELPCCPHCGNVLMMAPLEEFVESALNNPGRFGTGGIDTFLAAHSRNCDTCHMSWSEYAESSKFSIEIEL